MNNHIYRALATTALTLCFTSLSLFAAPPATKYMRGETLDPACAPGDPNCAVEDFLDTDNQILSISGSLLSISRGNSIALPAATDNLGNHTATQNIRLNGMFLSNDGDSEGVYVGANGRVGIGTTSPASTLDIFGAAAVVPLNIKINDGVTSPITMINSANHNIARIGQLAGGNASLTLGAAAGGASLSSNGSTLVTNHFRVNYSVAYGPTNTDFVIQGNRSTRYLDFIGGGQIVATIDGSSKALVVGRAYSTGSLSRPVDGMVVQGSVGVGTELPTAKLDVAGNIKVANSNSICGTSNAGEIRYNAATSKHEGCNGTGRNTLY